MIISEKVATRIPSKWNFSLWCENYWNSACFS